MTLISVIIPVAGAHHNLVPYAVASCIWQSIADMEVIVVNDGIVDVAEFVDRRVRVIDSPNRRRDVPVGNRAAVARNAGVSVASGEFVVFLDADDYLLPTAFETLIRGQATHNATYTFSSHYAGQSHLRPPNYDQNLMKEFNIHPITTLIPRSAFLSVGGFDESAPGWEDWTLYLRLAIAGHCGQYYRGPIFVYQDQHSVNHIIDVAGGKELMERVTAPYRNRSGEIIMAKCCGSNNHIARSAAATLGEIHPQADGTQILEYTGAMSGSSIVRHPISKRTYKYGANTSVKFMTVPTEDVDFFLSMGNFRIVAAPAPWSPPPSPAQQITQPFQLDTRSEQVQINTQQVKSFVSVDAEFEAMIAQQIASQVAATIAPTDDIADVSIESVTDGDTTKLVTRRGRKKNDA